MRQKQVLEGGFGLELPDIQGLWLGTQIGFPCGTWLKTEGPL